MLRLKSEELQPGKYSRKSLEAYCTKHRVSLYNYIKLYSISSYPKLSWHLKNYIFEDEGEWYGGSSYVYNRIIFKDTLGKMYPFAIHSFEEFSKEWCAPEDNYYSTKAQSAERIFECFIDSDILIFLCLADNLKHEHQDACIFLDVTETEEFVNRIKELKYITEYLAIKYSSNIATLSIRDDAERKRLVESFRKKYGGFQDMELKEDLKAFNFSEYIKKRLSDSKDSNDKAFESEPNHVIKLTDKAATTSTQSPLKILS